MALGSDTAARAELARRDKSGGWTVGRMLALALLILIGLVALAVAL